jgi:hypothetical protein
LYYSFHTSNIARTNLFVQHEASPKMKNIILILLTLTFAVACGSNNKNSNARLRNLDVSDDAKMTLADKGSDEKVICKQTRRTGSHRITTVCRSQSEIKAQREATQFQLRGKNHQTGASGGEAGGR